MGRLSQHVDAGVRCVAANADGDQLGHVCRIQFPEAPEDVESESEVPGENREETNAEVNIYAVANDSFR